MKIYISNCVWIWRKMPKELPPRHSGSPWWQAPPYNPTIPPPNIRPQQPRYMDFVTPTISAYQPSSSLITVTPTKTTEAKKAPLPTPTGNSTWGSTGKATCWACQSCDVEITHQHFFYGYGVTIRQKIKKKKESHCPLCKVTQSLTLGNQRATILMGTQELFGAWLHSKVSAHSHSDLEFIEGASVKDFRTSF